MGICTSKAINYALYLHTFRTLRSLVMPLSEQCFKITKNVSFWHFLSIFVQLALDLSGNTVWPQATVFPKNVGNVIKWDFLSDFKTLCFCPFLLSCFLFCHKFSPLHFWEVLTWCLLYESFKKHFRFPRFFKTWIVKRLLVPCMWPLWFHYDNFHKLVIEASRLLSWYGSLHHALLW